MKTVFYKLLSDFEGSGIAHEMKLTSENSPHHRESNVWVHTAMVLEQYAQLTPDVWGLNHVCGALACLFHDTGKPAARAPRYSTERGDYFAYPGHELVSARLWEEWAVTNHVYLSAIFTGFTPNHISLVMMMVEHHISYNIKKAAKLRPLCALVEASEGAYLHVLRADCRGRITDAGHDRSAQVEGWVSTMMGAGLPNTITTGRMMIMMIGASGSGKTTQARSIAAAFVEQHPDLSATIFSLDEERHRFSGLVDYRAAYDFCIVNELAFTAYVTNRYNTLLRGNIDCVIIDNTNTSSKTRTKYLQVARVAGRSTTAVHMLTHQQSLEHVLSTRDDKIIPQSVAIRQYCNTHTPLYGEFDYIVSLISPNA